MDRATRIRHSGRDLARFQFLRLGRLYPVHLLFLLLAPPLAWLGVIYLGSLFALLLQSLFYIDEFSGMVVPTVKKLTYHVHLKRVMLRKLVLGIADGVVHADDKQIYEVSGLKVGLVQDAAVAAAAG
jgi:hypothetical protein